MTKTCSLCKLEKDGSEFNRRSRSRDGLRAECKECQRAAYLKAKSKDPVAFNAAANKRKKEWRQSNPDAGKIWYAANREKERARDRNKRSRLGAQMNARRRARYAADPVFRAKMRAAAKDWEVRNKERMREYARQYCQENIAKLTEKSRRRRALQLERQVTRFTLDQLDGRMSVFGYCCAYCGGPFEEIDHAIPLSKGGLHCLANLRPACRPCNRRKWAKPFAVWMQELAEHKQLTA